MKNWKYKKIVPFVVVFLFFGVLGYLFPYTNDDWAWGSSIGINRLNNFFANYNGRYLGNLLVILLTRFRIIRALVMAVILTLITFLINKIIQKETENKTILLIAIFLMILMPRPIFRQAIAWTSGFTNYVPPVLLILIWFYLSRNILDNKEIKLNKFWSIPVLILGICSCLFMEHVTIYAVIIGIVGLIYSYKKKIKINLSQITYLIGTIIGSILMFQNEAYHHIIKGDDFYRKVPKDGFIMKSIKRYFHTIYDNLFLNNTIILLLIAVCCLFLFFRFVYKKKNIKHKKLMYFSLGTIVFYAIYSLISQFFPDWESLTLILKYLEGCLTAIYFVALLLYIILLPNKISKNKLFFFLGSIVLLTLPLFIVSPVTPRCFYPMYIIWILFTLQLLFDCFKYIKSDKFYVTINYISLFAIVISMFYFICIIFSAFYVTNKMVNYIEKEKKNKSQVMVLPKTVYEDYMKHPYPHDETNTERFKMFYDIDDSVKLKFIDYKDWRVIIKSR